MKFIPLALMETYVSKTEAHAVVLADYGTGIHCTPHAFFKKDTDGTVPWVISRICDHAGGQLKFCDGDHSKAVCPLHNWEFDFDTLSYSKIPNQPFEHITKKPLPYQVRDGVLHYETEHLNLRVPASVAATMEPVVAEVRHLTHASVLITVDGLKILTDPWFIGECLEGGWWLKHPPKSDAWDILASADLLYLSHNHPDHLHEETLAHARKDIPIIAPKFDSDSVTRPLRELGFNNVHELEAKRVYRIEGSNVLVSILPTGDHREDSALFVGKGDFTVVLTVDCVGANQYVMPENPTMLLTNFAGGASGWPLCYEVVGPIEERKKIVTKNRGNAVVEMMKYIQVSQPRSFMPYAGFFEELAPRDALIRQYNVKNTSASVVEKVQAKFPDVLAVDPLVHDTLHWENGMLSSSSVDLPPLFTYDDATIESYLAKQRATLKYFDIHQVAKYFSQSEFRDELIVYLVLTDDDYKPNGESLRLDFSSARMAYDVIDGENLLNEFHALTELSGKRHMLLKARRDSMWQIVYHGRPLEELSLGFQCRIDRKPDQYNATFWKHYTTHGAPMLRRGEDHLLYKLLEGAE